jgi:hypothetical protein
MMSLERINSMERKFREDWLKPCETQQMFGVDQQVASLKSYLTGDPSVRKALCLLAGKSGVGKTASLRCVAREMGYRVVEINHSTFKGQNEIYQKMVNVCLRMNLDSSLKPLLIIEDIDGGHESSMKSVLSAISRYVESSKTSPGRAPVFCTCNGVTKAIQRLHRSYTIVYFKELSFGVLQSISRNTFKKMGLAELKLTDEEIASSAGDARKVIQCCWMKAIYNGRSSSGAKDCSINAYESVRVYFTPDADPERKQTAKGVLSSCGQTAGALCLSNYARLDGMRPTSSDFSAEISSYAEDLSSYDMINHSQYVNNQRNEGVSQEYLFLASQRYVTATSACLLGRTRGVTGGFFQAVTRANNKRSKESFPDFQRAFQTFSFCY